MNQIEIESLAAITAATEPVGSADIFGNIQSASCIKDISRAIYRLKQRGDIVEIAAWPALDASIAEWLCDLATQLEAQS